MNTSPPSPVGRHADNTNETKEANRKAVKDQKKRKRQAETPPRHQRGCGSVIHQLPKAAADTFTHRVTGKHIFSPTSPAESPPYQRPYRRVSTSSVIRSRPCEPRRFSKFIPVIDANSVKNSELGALGLAGFLSDCTLRIHSKWLLRMECKSSIKRPPFFFFSSI